MHQFSEGPDHLDYLENGFVADKRILDFLLSLKLLRIDIFILPLA